MAININMSGLNINGNAELLNGMTINGGSKVDIQVKDTELYGNASMMNNTETKDSNVEINISDVTMGDNSSAFNNWNVTNGEFEANVQNRTFGPNTSFMDNVTVTNSKDSVGSSASRADDINFLKNLGNWIREDQENEDKNTNSFGRRR